jgi:hypothetical protein
MMTLANQPYICGYCNKGFTQEKTLFVHMCEQKRRHLAKNEKHVQLAYQTYDKFYKLAQKNDKTKPGYWACRLPRYAKSLGLSGGGKWW